MAEGGDWSRNGSLLGYYVNESYGVFVYIVCTQWVKKIIAAIPYILQGNSGN